MFAFDSTFNNLFSHAIPVAKDTWMILDVLGTVHFLQDCVLPSFINELWKYFSVINEGSLSHSMTHLGRMKQCSQSIDFLEGHLLIIHNSALFGLVILGILLLNE